LKAISFSKSTQSDVSPYTHNLVRSIATYSIFYFLLFIVQRALFLFFYATQFAEKERKSLLKASTQV
jgi:hypothetical protein